MEEIILNTLNHIVKIYSMSCNVSQCAMLTGICFNFNYDLQTNKPDYTLVAVMMPVRDHMCTA